MTGARVIYPVCLECEEKECRSNAAKEEEMAKNTIIERTTFEDGDRFVIVYKNCDPALKSRILEALAKAEADLPEDVTAKTEEDVPVYPVNDPIPEVPVIPEGPEQTEEQAPVTFRSGPYKGMTPAAVLEQFGDNGYGNLNFLKEKQKFAEMKEEIEKAMKKYFKARFGSESPNTLCAKWTQEETENFFKIFGTLLTEEDKQKVLKTVGAIDYDVYMADAPLETKKSLAAAVIIKYAK